MKSNAISDYEMQFVNLYNRETRCVVGGIDRRRWAAPHEMSNLGTNQSLNCADLHKTKPKG